MKETGKSAKDIFSTIKYLIGMSGIKADEEARHSYDDMNKLIGQEFDKLED